MDLPFDWKDGITAGCIGIVTYFWRKLNGAMSREEFKEWVKAHEKRMEEVIEKAETSRRETRDTLINIFKDIKDHIGNDAEVQSEIKESLARLEERSKLRRSSDA